MPNRFNNIYDNQYVSTYVPLPFEEIIAAGAGKQKSYDTAVKEEDALANLKAKIKYRDTVDAFGKSYAVEDGNYVRQRFDKLSKDLEAQADEIAKGDKGSQAYRDFIRKEGRKLQEEMSTGRLAEINTAAMTYDEQQKAMAEAKDLGKSGWRALEIERNRAKYGANKGILGTDRLSTANVGEFVDRNKELDDLTKGINEEVTSLYAAAQDGYIKTGKREEITPEKIRNTVRNFMGNSQAITDIRREYEYNIERGADPVEAEKVANNQIKEIEDALVYKYTKSTASADMKNDSLFNMREGHAREDALLEPKFDIGYEPSMPGQGSKEVLNNSLHSLGLDGFNFDNDGKFHINTDTDSIYKIDGKIYKRGDKLPEGYKTVDAVWGADTSIKGPKGETIRPSKGYDIKEQHAQISKVAERLGIKIDKADPNWMEKVGTSIKTLMTSNSNYTAFDAGTVNALGSYYGMKADKDGMILDPGSMSYVTLKDANGNLLKGTDSQEIANQITGILRGGRMLGSSKSITDKTSAGDMAVQGSDGQVYYMNTNLKKLNEAQKSSHNLFSSVGRYITKGDKYNGTDTKELATIAATEQAAAATKVSGKTIQIDPNSIKVINKEYSKDGNKEYITVLVPGPNGTPEAKALVIDHKTQSYKMRGLDEAALELDSQNLKEPLKFYSEKRYDKIATTPEQ